LAYRLLERAAKYVVDKPFPDAIAGKPYCVVLRLSVDMTRNWDGITTNAVSRRLKVLTTIACIYCLGCPLAHQIAPSLSVEDRCNFSIRLAHIVEAHKDYVSEVSALEGNTVRCFSADAANGLALCSRWMMKTTSNWKMASFLLSESKRNWLSFSP